MQTDKRNLIFIVLAHFMLWVKSSLMEKPFIAKGCIEYTLQFEGIYGLTTLVVLGTDCTNVCIFNYNTIVTMHDSHIFRKRYIIPNIILYTNRKELCVYKRHIFIIRRQTFAGINCKIAAVKQIAHAETIWPIKWKCNFSHSIRKCIKMKIYKDQL
jgi:hypothetical protein